jgi:hypothetical protein
LVVIRPVFQPFNKLLKQNFFLDRTKVALSLLVNNQLVLDFEGKIGGTNGLDTLEKAHCDECYRSDFSQRIPPLI